MSAAPQGANHMAAHGENKGELVRYDARFDSYALPVSKTVSQDLQFCPWCGIRLPESQREKWFDELEAQGFDPMVSDDYPDRYKSAEWRLTPMREGGR